MMMMILLTTVFGYKFFIYRAVLKSTAMDPSTAIALVTMSVESGDQPGATEPCHCGPAVCKFRCILCRQRFWKKDVIIRRSAKCRGARFNTDGSRWKCKAWRCRFNDQCPNANSACPICGAYKPPEFRPTLPAPETNPAIMSRSASSADPNPALASYDITTGRIDRLSRSMYGHSEGSDVWQR